MDFQKVIFIVLFFAFPRSWASLQACFPQDRIVLPNQLIYFYLSESNFKRALPIGNSDCQVSKSEISIVSAETQQKVGSFRHEKKVATAIDELSLNQKLGDKDFLALLAAKPHPANFWMRLFSLLQAASFPNSPMKLRKEVYFSIGTVSGFSLAPLNWDPYTPTQKHWGAKNIKYDEFIQFYGQPNAQFVQIDLPNKSEIPITVNLSHWIHPLNIHQLSTPDMVSLAKPNARLIEDPIVVISRGQNDWSAYNTITRLYGSGYRKIYWFNDSTNAWRNLPQLPANFYEPKYKVVTNAQLSAFIQQNNGLKILDLSPLNLFDTVQFTKSTQITLAYAPGPLYRQHMKKILKPDVYAQFDKTTAARLGTWYLPNSKALFPSASTILVTTGEQYEGNTLLRQIYSQLETEGHKVHIHNSGAGGFLSFLKQQNQKNDFVTEKNSLFIQFDSFKSNAENAN